MYRPNFCAQCGTKVLHLRWSWWTSRRFCVDCARRFRRVRLARPLLAGLALVASGYLVGRSRQPPPPPLIIERRADSPLGDIARVPAADAPTPNGVAGTGGSDNSASPAIEEDVYLCGARTKKGTPCSRRVHSPARCWQHKGMPAMLSAEKLVIKE